MRFVEYISSVKVESRIENEIEATGSYLCEFVKEL
jgi:hypothetical protein